MPLVWLLPTIKSAPTLTETEPELFVVMLPVAGVVVKFWMAMAVPGPESVPFVNETVNGVLASPVIVKLPAVGVPEKVNPVAAVLTAPAGDIVTVPPVVGA